MGVIPGDRTLVVGLSDSSSELAMASFLVVVSYVGDAVVESLREIFRRRFFGVIWWKD